MTDRQLEPGLDLDELSRGDRTTYELFMHHVRQNKIVSVGVWLAVIGGLFFNPDPWHQHGFWRTAQAWLPFAGYLAMVVGVFIETALNRRIRRLNAAEDAAIEQGLQEECRRRIRPDATVLPLRPANADRFDR